LHKILLSMRNILNRPYDLLESKTFKYLFVFGGSCFTFIFLWVFTPYGLHKLTTTSSKAFSIGLYAGIGFLLFYFQYFIVQPFAIKKYTVLKTIGWLMLSFFMFGTSSYIINAYVHFNGQLTIKEFFYFQGVILSILIIPLSLFLLIHYNLTLKKRLNAASKFNETLHGKETIQETNFNAIINSENSKESFSLSLDALLYVTSEDNYIKVYFIENNEIRNKLLRYSLSKIESDNQDIDQIVRCHKSYIINKNKIESICGNSGGYKIKLKDYNVLIPLSRKWNSNLSALTSL
jgi:hypothetical protein